MGLFSDLLWNPKKRKQLEEAANQMWGHISMGANFEIPLHLKKDDPLLQAVQVLQKKHPEVKLRMYQSKGLVLGLHKPGVSIDASPEAMGMLQKGQYFGTAGDIPVEKMLDEHVAWLQSRGFDPKQAEAEAQAADAARHRIEVGSLEKTEAPSTEAKGDARETPDAGNPEGAGTQEPKP